MIIYPKPDKKEQGDKALKECFKRGFITENEMDTYLETGGLTLEILAKIRMRIEFFANQFKTN